MESVFDLILETAVAENLPPEKMVKTLFVFTDMQFNEASSSNEEVLMDTITRKFTKANYKRPQLVFWNIRSSTKKSAFPVTVSHYGTAFVSGFSAILLTAFLSGTGFNAIDIMNNLIEKYDVEVNENER